MTRLIITLAFLLAVAQAGAQTITNRTVQSVTTVCATNSLGHMTIRQKLDYAAQLRDIGCLGAAIDVIIEAVRDIVAEQERIKEQHRHEQFFVPAPNPAPFPFPNYTNTIWPTGIFYATPCVEVGGR